MATNVFGRSVKLFALVSALVLVMAACSGDDDGATEGADAPASASQGDPAPAFTAETLDGGEFSSASFAGEPTVLWFWAPWCASCRAEAPSVIAASEAFDGQVEIIGVAGRDEVSAMEQFVADTGTGDLVHLVDADTSIWADYRVFSQPAFAFIDADGNAEVHVGMLGEERLTERMAALQAS